MRFTSLNCRISTETLNYYLDIIAKKLVMINFQKRQSVKCLLPDQVKITQIMVNVLGVMVSVLHQNIDRTYPMG